MTLNLQMPPQQRDDLKPRITVFGVGGAGGNAVNNMIDRQLEGCEFVVANTDAQALQQSRATARVQMGVKVTEGLGAGARPTVGSAAAEESIEEIVDHLAGSHMCFITAGMGGGTGTGATPIIAQAARELGVLTVGVVTKPFQFEGSKRMRQAEEGIEALQKVVDTLIIIPNQNLFRIANEKTTCADAFGMADDVLYQGVKGVTDLMVRPGLINLDFADVRAVMDEMGKAMMGTGEAEGEDRAMQAAEKAIANPLLDEISLHGAKGVLINIIGGNDLTIYELDEAANVIREKVDQDANIIVGSTLDDEMVGKVRVSVVATGIDTSEKAEEAHVPRRRLAEPLSTGDAQRPMAHEAELEQEADRSDFFGDWQPRAAEQHDVHETDALPEPEYQPRPEPVEPQQAARRPGEPNADALARLQRAVSKSPDQQGQQRPQAPRAGMRRPQQPEAGQEERSRFGINSLINRISGQHQSEPHQQEPSAPERPQRPVAAGPAPTRRAAAPQQAAQYDEEDDVSAEQDRIEIPAFLRRQAN